MMILDLNSIESPVFTFTESYFGKPFIFCTDRRANCAGHLCLCNDLTSHLSRSGLLLDYGGRRGMFGNINATATLPISTLQAGNTTMVGTGITPEAIENNPIMFNLMFEMGWRDSFFDVDDWVRCRCALLGSLGSPLMWPLVSPGGQLCVASLSVFQDTLPNGFGGLVFVTAHAVHHPYHRKHHPSFTRLDHVHQHSSQCNRCC